MRAELTAVGGWAKNSFIDYSGTVSTVLFFSGCNLRCPYCHNPLLARNRSGESVPSDIIWQFLEERRSLIQGVVLSGGEPALRTDLKEIVALIRMLGYAIKLDTNGMLPERIREAAPDYLALDVKTLPRNYASLLQAPYQDAGERLLESIKIAKAMGANAEIRITLAPKLINCEIIAELGRALEGAGKVYLQRMQTGVELLDSSMKELPPISLEEIEEYRKILAEFVGACEIRNYDK
jgi:pyruvate formate lyase activating enzyme